MGDFSAEICIGNITSGDMNPVTALVDTGATESAFPADFLDYLSIPPSEKPIYKFCPSQSMPPTKN